MLSLFIQPDHSQSFLTTFRKDLPSSTTFGLQTLDGGSNPQGAANAGIEAVRSFLLPSTASASSVSCIELGYPVHCWCCGWCTSHIHFCRTQQQWRHRWIPRYYQLPHQRGIATPGFVYKLRIWRTWYSHEYRQVWLAYRLQSRD